MRQQRQSKVPLRYEDTIHNINNSKHSKQKTVSKNKSNSKEYVNSKESDDAVRDGENNVNLEPNREEGEENTGVFGTDDYEVHSSTDSDNKRPTSPLQGNNGNNCSPNADGSLPKPVYKIFSYASMVMSDAIPNSLDFIPTLITESGNEVVIFDEEIVQKGSERWCLTVCGHFVSYDMHINELRDEVGMNIVLEKGPWMVRNKLLFVQKWSSEIGMSMVEPKKLPVWVKLSNVPLEAWCVKGISAMASSLGKRILMDTVTATMCHKGIGNFGYARVLVEMDAEKDLKSEIEIQYVDKGNNIKGNKKVQVVYDWKPPKCSHCKVFGHEIKGCKKGGDVLSGDKNDRGYGDQKADTITDFSIQGRRKQHWNNRPSIYANQQHQYQQNKKEFRRKQPENANNVKNNSEANYAERNKWKVKDNAVKDIRSTANKYSILDLLPEDNDLELKTLKERMIVDTFLNEKIQPTLLESITWSKDMIKYFKDKWEIDRIKESGVDIEEDVLEVNNGTTNVMRDKDISETRLKSKKLVKACDRVFQRWSWVSNMQDCIKGCRIVIGWDDDETSVQVIHKTSQSIFLNEKRYVNGNPWGLAGDLNVTLHPNEHSCGSSVMSCDMIEFQECLNKIEEFLPLVKEKWSHDSNGVYMYQVVQKMKKLKSPLNHLGWSKGSIFKRVELLREKLQKVQTEIDKEPHNFSLRDVEATLVKEFHDAEASDEEKFLWQQAKIKWLSEGDKNSSYFHKVLKGRNNKSKNVVPLFLDLLFMSCKYK
uniref:DUF4283 domain-containing protein n=1 Tax=Tanacetum cinerariifolium TaxID=118510 RepID=A0A699J3Y0_TANCI|nr:hypothetical protein [Tanacetum cinerariifolium]